MISKAKWFQHHYLQEISEPKIVEAFEDFLDKKGVLPTSRTSEIVHVLKGAQLLYPTYGNKGVFSMNLQPN